MMTVTYILVMKPGIFPRRVPVVYAEYSKQQKQNFLYIQGLIKLSLYSRSKLRLDSRS